MLQGNIVTTCGITSIKHNPGDQRLPISAAKLEDDKMKDVLESSGANNFFTLVRYNPPELLEDYNYFKKLEKEEKDKKRLSVEDDIKTLSSLPSEEAETAEDIIFTLFGPRVWEHNGKCWMRRVSTAPASRYDVLYLTERLDCVMVDLLTTSEGICQTRRELFGQLFEELIRQEMINCKEKGLLLLRIRTELKQTLMSYQGWEDLLERKHKLEAEVKQLENTKRNWMTEVEIITKEMERLIQDQLKQQMEDMQTYNKANNQLKAQLQLMPPEFLSEDLISQIE